MTALAKARLITERNNARRVFPVGAGLLIWQGALVALNVANAMAADNVAAHRVVGVATATANNVAGAAGDVKVETASGCFFFNNDAADPLTAADIGLNCYVTDDNTVCKTAGTKPVAGVVYDVEANGAWVKVG